jgi:hypothetical protein
MNLKIKEKHKLPLTFNYMESFKTQNTGNKMNDIIFFIKCEKYQSNFHVRENSGKALVRFL